MNREEERFQTLKEIQNDPESPDLNMKIIYQTSILYMAYAYIYKFNRIYIYTYNIETQSQKNAGSPYETNQNIQPKPIKTVFLRDSITLW